MVAIDHRALGALAALSDLDIAVPDGISVIGFNGLGENAVFYPAAVFYHLSRFAAPGEIGVGHLLNMIHRPGAGSTRYVLKPILAQKECGFYFENQSRIFAR